MNPPPATLRQRYGKSLLIGLVVLLGCLGLIATADFQQRSHTHKTAANLADVIVSQLASGASKAMLTGDRLALQSQVKELVRYHAIPAAAVLDANHSPLAVAGNEHGSDSYTVVAAITVDHSIAGYAKVTLSTSPDWIALQDTWVILSALCCALLAFAVSAASTSGAQDSASNYDAASEDAQPVPALGAEVSMQLFPDLATSHPLQPLLARVIVQVCKLYDGDPEESAAGSTVYAFHGQDYNSRAFCAARLWQQWLLHMAAQYPGLEFNIIIQQAGGNDAAPPAMAPDAIYLTRTMLAEGNLANRISIVEEDDDWYRVLSVNHDYHHLLQRQLARILPANAAD